MSAPASTCPLTYSAGVELYFMEHRAKLIDIAAFLDRLRRTADGATAPEDFRVRALRECLMLLCDGQGDYARRVLLHLSDTSREPIAAAGTKGASGACAPVAGGAA